MRHALTRYSHCPRGNKTVQCSKAGAHLYKRTPSCSKQFHWWGWWEFGLQFPRILRRCIKSLPLYMSKLILPRKTARLCSPSSTPHTLEQSPRNTVRFLASSPNILSASSFLVSAVTDPRVPDPAFGSMQTFGKPPWLEAHLVRFWFSLVSKIPGISVALNKQYHGWPWPGNHLCKAGVKIIHFTQTEVLDLTPEDAKPESISEVAVGSVMWLEVSEHPSRLTPSSLYQASTASAQGSLAPRASLHRPLSKWRSVHKRIVSTTRLNAITAWKQSTLISANWSILGWIVFISYGCI